MDSVQLQEILAELIGARIALRPRGTGEAISVDRLQYDRPVPAVDDADCRGRGGRVERGIEFHWRTSPSAHQN